MHSSTKKAEAWVKIVRSLPHGELSTYDQNRVNEMTRLLAMGIELDELVQMNKESNVRERALPDLMGEGRL